MGEKDKNIIPSKTFCNILNFSTFTSFTLFIYLSLLPRIMSYNLLYHQYVNDVIFLGLKFSARKYVFILTMGTSNGEMGKVRVQRSSANVVYSILGKTPLIDIDKATGKLALLKDLDEIAAVQFNNTQVTIQAATNDQSEMANTNVIIIILPLSYGDNFAHQAMQKARAVVKTNHIFKSGKFKITANALHRFLRKISRSDPAKGISMAQTRVERAIQIIKRKIILLFSKLFFINILQL